MFSVYCLLISLHQSFAKRVIIYGNNALATLFLGAQGLSPPIITRFQAISLQFAKIRPPPQHRSAIVGTTTQSIEAQRKAHPIGNQPSVLRISRLKPLKRQLNQGHPVLPLILRRSADTDRARALYTSHRACSQRAPGTRIEPLYCKRPGIVAQI